MELLDWLMAECLLAIRSKLIDRASSVDGPRTAPCLTCIYAESICLRGISIYGKKRRHDIHLSKYNSILKLQHTTVY